MAIISSRWKIPDSKEGREQLAGPGEESEPNENEIGKVNFFY
jgi:hypothetical protein